MGRGTFARPSFVLFALPLFRRKGQKMKIKYEFANETVEIEVDEEWGNLLIDLNRQEYNNDHAETRRHCSLNALNLDDTYRTLSRRKSSLLHFP